MNVGKRSKSESGVKVGCGLVQAKVNVGKRSVSKSGAKVGCGQWLVGE